MKILVLGDIHGRSIWRDIILKENDADKIIFLGDYVSTNNPYITSEVQISELTKILTYKDINKDKVILLRGNHDMCFLNYLRTGQQNLLWNHGGRETYESYYNNCDGDIEKFPVEHLLFFKNQFNYYVDEDNRCFVHVRSIPWDKIKRKKNRSSSKKRCILLL
jgi:hypothetical protein